MRRIALFALSAWMLCCGLAQADVRLVFVGDILIHETQLKTALAAGEGKHEFRPPFGAVASMLGGDVVVGNFETTLAGEKNGYGGYPSFNTPDTLADALRDLRFNVLLTANNHNLDRGTAGSIRTWETLESYGFHLVGLPWSGPLLLNVGGMRLGVINYTYGSNTLRNFADGSPCINIIDRERMAADIRQLRKNGADYIVAAVHWGQEYFDKPNQSQTSLAKWLFEQSVDLIVGAHPHVLQPIEIINKDEKIHTVAWSLGNFISSQGALERRTTVILRVDVAPKTDGNGWEMSGLAVAPVVVQSRPTESGERLKGTYPAEFYEGKQKLVEYEVDSRNAALLVRKLMGINKADEDGFYPLYARQAPPVQSASAR